MFMWGWTHYPSLKRKLLILNMDLLHSLPTRFEICPNSKSGLMTGLLDFAEHWTRPLPTFLCSWITLVPGFHQAFPAQPSLTVCEPPSRTLLWAQSATLIQTPRKTQDTKRCSKALIRSNREDTDAIAVLLLQFTLETVNEENHSIQSSKCQDKVWLFYMSTSATLFRWVDRK